MTGLGNTAGNSPNCLWTLLITTDQLHSSCELEFTTIFFIGLSLQLEPHSFVHHMELKTVSTSDLRILRVM